MNRRTTALYALLVLTGGLRGPDQTNATKHRFKLGGVVHFKNVPRWELALDGKIQTIDRTFIRAELRALQHPDGLVQVGSRC